MQAHQESYPQGSKENGVSQKDLGSNAGPQADLRQVIRLLCITVSSLMHRDILTPPSRLKWEKL